MSTVRPVRIGIVSTANIARQQVIPGFRTTPWLEVVAIASRNADTAQAAAAALGIPVAHGSYEALLADFAEHPRTIIVSSHLINEIETMLETVTIIHQGRLLLSEEADELRARGATLTGPADAVDRLTAGQTVIGSRDLGPTRQATHFGDLDTAVLDRAADHGVTAGPVPLQDLFIHLTEHPTRTEAHA